ncbi:MAG TPA: hypothetical protein VFX60_09780 [Micromonospora sp.]|nr:hypothetical protein [Micromonospora sp.]
MAQRSSSGRGATAVKNRPGNEPGTPQVRESDIAQLRVDEIRGELKKRGVSGISGQRKDELVKTLAKTMRAEQKGKAPAAKKPATAGKESSTTGGGPRRGGGSARSLKYAQHISSPDEKPSRPGRSLVTTDHEVIQQWAQARDAKPATIQGTEHDGRPGVLRFNFPGFKESGRIREISWTDWFKTFDSRRLNFIYQETRTNGGQSNFFRLESPEREDA